nr:hypothetical protein [Tanacetum cinerariifolium]
RAGDLRWRRDLRQGELQLRWRAASARRAEPEHPARGKNRFGWALRRGQIHADQPAAALLRRGQRRDSHRRTEHRARHPGQPA